ncbi:cytochrome c oxidase assembly protein subunit 17 [Kwoniella mangroviensis CBS 8886]|uniref:uncharacterized protein n=1 Tax=Kwoniella mangroviensis CBS 8507 TaxID=1296122 RepID=UPI00080D14F4|nr:cytochrome c oxidase assembly protein subunit 17 [Kwoniella mangroviensis CBS 8507]OCF67887.1 cytochrome c oxidase assembly protein subunit 17 [Kwoniella mangroviensis CBS 8507]OCF78341.1 cytochrome c oxidase assembly protein subunit 17 [Kwoniella mangroviensis CBS 8886]
MSLLGSSSESCEITPVSSRSATPDTSNANVSPLNPQGLKPCCACPETKSKRDDCFLKSAPGEGDVNCREFIEAHKACMRGYGFKV